MPSAQVSPCRVANMAAWVRELVLVFARMCPTWLKTVLEAIDGDQAISLLVWMALGDQPQDFYFPGASATRYSNSLRGEPG